LDAAGVSRKGAEAQREEAMHQLSFAAPRFCAFAPLREIFSGREQNIMARFAYKAASLAF
jgi:hypothetical protein